MPTNSPKSRIFMLCANQGAKCYEDFEERLKNGVFKAYAAITHDKDVEDDGTIKKTHKHAIIELVNARSFSSVQKEFEGAHIEIPNYKKSAYQYLIHNSPKSKEKYQYAIEDIVTNSLDYVTEQINSEEYEPYLENKVFDYIAEGTISVIDFTLRFGQSQLKQWWSTYTILVQACQQTQQGRDIIENKAKAIEDAKPY